MVAGFIEITETKESSVAAARFGLTISTRSPAHLLTRQARFISKTRGKADRKTVSQPSSNVDSGDGVSAANLSRRKMFECERSRQCFSNRSWILLGIFGQLPLVDWCQFNFIEVRRKTTLQSEVDPVE